MNTNTIEITGNIGKFVTFRPEVGSGGLTTFSIANNRYRPTDQGYEKTRTEWFRCSAWCIVL
jgi:single-stranded DNA-binding protein